MKKILLIEDEMDLAKMVSLHLRNSGYEVIAAYDGKEGLDKIKQETPDLIILDLMLPKINGYKVCGLLKNDSRYSQIPVIMFSARAQESDMKQADELGADAYIMKPFKAQALIDKIRELLKE